MFSSRIIFIMTFPANFCTFFVYATQFDRLVGFRVVRPVVPCSMTVAVFGLWAVCVGACNLAIQIVRLVDFGVVLLVVP